MSQAYAKSNAASGPHKGGKNGPIKSTQGATSGGDNVGQRGRRADNSLMQQKLGTPAPASGMDEGAETLLSDFTTFQADYADSFGRASTLVQKAHSAQDGGDIPGRQQAIAELRDEKKGILSALDWFLPGYGITFQLSTHLEENPSLAQVPAFRDGVLRVASFANIVKQQRSLLIPFLIPRTVHGKKVPEIPGIPLGNLNFSDAVEGQEQLLDPLFSAALELRRQVAGAGHLSGPAAAALATELASGPIADFEPGSGEFEYLYTVVQSSNASADVRLRLDWLLGRDDFSVYQGLYGPAMAMGSMIQTQADVAAGNPKAPARFNSPFDLGSDEDDGICYLPGMAPKKLSDIFSLKTPAVNPQDKIAPGEVADRAAGKAPGIREFDSSEMPEEEEEEEAPKTSNGKPSDRGMGKVQTTTTREGKMVVGDGKVGGEASAKRVVKQRSGAGSSVGGGASLEAGEHLSGSANIAGKRTSKDGGTIGGSAQVGRDEEGNWNGKLRLEGESLDRKGSGVGGGKTIGYDEKKGVSIGQDLTVKEKGANGATTSTTGGLTVTTNGNLAATGGRTVEDAKGNKKGTTGSASYDHESGAFSGGVKYSNTNKNGDDLGSVGGTGSIDMDGKDGKTGAKGAITASKGSKTVSLSGGYSVKVEKPVQEGNRWVITWETDLSGELSGGVKGKKAGASATVGAGKKKTGRRSFATEAEAKAFFEHPKLDGMPSDATAVASMSEGDSRSTENSVNVGGDVNGKLGMVEVGVGGSHSSSDYQNLTKGEGGKVQVEVGTKELNEVHGNVGISGVSWGAGHSAASNESVTVEFDLSTPEGKNAFQHHQKFHALPARGWRVVGTAKGNASTNSYNLGLLGVKIGTSHTVSHEEELSEGNKYERDSGTDASSVSVPLLGSYSRSHRLSMLQVNDGRSFFNTESTVKGSDLDDVRSGLAKSALGTEQGSGGSNKGTYRLQASISEADMDHFIRVAGSADAAKTFNYHGGLHATDGLEDLQDGLRKAAGDKDAQRRVLARWVADEGVDALQTLHTLTHGKFDQGGAGGTSMFVAIDGDPYMNGMKGQLDLELRIQGWDRRLAGGERGPALVSEIRKDIVFQREKAKHLESCSELPHRVYEQEYDRIRSNTTILESVLQRAMESDGASAASASNLQSPKFAAFRRATLNLSVARTKCDHALEDAYPRYKIEHKGAYSDNGRGRAQDLPAEKNAYAAALKSYENGEAARGAALQAESLSGQPLNEDSVAPLTALVTKARFEYLRAVNFYKAASDAWFEINSRNIGKAYRGYAGQRMAPGS